MQSFLFLSDFLLAAPGAVVSSSPFLPMRPFQRHHEACDPSWKCTGHLIEALQVAGDGQTKGTAKVRGAPRSIWQQAWQGARRRLDRGVMVTAILTSTLGCSPASDQVLVPNQSQCISIGSLLNGALSMMPTSLPCFYCCIQDRRSSCHWTERCRASSCSKPNRRRGIWPEGRLCDTL